MTKLRKGQSFQSGWTVKSENYFDKRKQVMSIIYKARDIYKNAPRVEVKIMTDNGGLGWLNKNIIAIGEDVSDTALTHVVLHELCHTWFGLEHDEGCTLMKSRYSSNEKEEIAWARFQSIVHCQTS